MVLDNTAFRIITSIIASAFCFFLASISLNRYSASRQIKIFILANVALGLWNISDLLMVVVPPAYTLVTDRTSYLFALFVVPLFFLLLIEVSREEEEPYKIPQFLIAGCIFLLSIVYTPFLIENVTTTPTFKEEPGIFYPVFVLYFLVWIYLGLKHMYKSFIGSNGYKRNQLKYLFLAISIGFVAAINYFISVFVPSWPPLYYLIEMIYCMVVAYAVIRFKLMDFTLLFRWGFALGVLLSIGALFFATGIYLSELASKRFNFEPGVVTLVAVLLLVFIYESLRLKIIDVIDRFIYQSPDFKDLLVKIDQSITESKTINELSSNLTLKIKEIWKVGHAGLVIWNTQKALYEPVPLDAFVGLNIHKITNTIPQSDFLVRTLEDERRLFSYGVVLEDEVNGYGHKASPGERTTFWKIRRTMHWLGAAACVPIVNKSKLVGFFVLGQKISGAAFNNEDKKFLSHIGQTISKVVVELIFLPANQAT